MGIRYILLFSLALGACSSEGSDKSPKAVTSTSAASANATASAAASIGTSAAAPKVDKSAGFAFQKLAVGQFVEYRNGSKRYGWAVVGEQDGALWMQLVADVEGQTMAMQMLVDIQDGSQIHTAKPKRMKFKIPGRGVQEVDGAMLGMGDKMRGQGTFLLDMSAEEVNQATREDVAVKAGRFSGAYRWKGKTKRGEATFWSHPSVPITAIVKGVDDEGTWELVKYGMSGAKSEL